MLIKTRGRTEGIASKRKKVRGGEKKRRNEGLELGENKREEEGKREEEMRDWNQALKGRKTIGNKKRSRWRKKVRK